MPAVVLCIVLGGFVGLRLADTPTNALLLLVHALLIASVLGYVVRARARVYGVTEFAALFSLAFIAYNALLPFEAGVAYLSDREPAFRGFVSHFSSETYVAASQLGLLAAVALAAGILCGGRLRPLPRRSIELVRLASNHALRIATALLLVALVGAVIQVALLGGLHNALSVSRGARLDLLNYGSAQSLPYWAPALGGFLLLTSHYYLTRKRVSLAVLIVALTLWTAFNLATGERGMVVYAFLVVVGAAAACSPGVIRRHRRAVWVLVLSGYILLAVFSNVRSFLPQFFSDDVEGGLIAREVVRDAHSGWLVPSSTEFASPYFTLLTALETAQPPLNGSSYVLALPDLLPRAVHPSKPYPLGRSFAQEMHQRHPGLLSRARGWGYSPVAEAFRNFGTPGVVAVFLVVGLAASQVSRLWALGYLGFALHILLLTQTINLNRSNFTLIESFFLGLTAVGMWAGLRLVAAAPGSYRPARPLQPRTSGSTRR